jgi:Zn-dependent protease with chaperone function
MQASSRVGPLVDYFDGATSKPQAARVRVDGTSLVINSSHDGTELHRVPLREVRWPERQRHGPRVVHFDKGGVIHCTDSAAWDAFARDSGIKDSWVVRTQQRWAATLAALAATVALIAGGYVWGLPAAAHGVVALVPESWDEKAGDIAMSSLPAGFLKPTQLEAGQQQRIRDAFSKALAAHYGDKVPKHNLRFHASDIGPNAFAMPGGTIVLTDEMVKLVDGREDVLVGVLGHEIGHVRHRHSMKQLAQVAGLGAVASLVFGDFSSLLTTIPVVIGQAAYSRDHERESDAETVALLRSAGISPDVMVVMFERMCAWRPQASDKPESAETPKAKSAEATPSRPCSPAKSSGGGWASMLESHPIPAERIEYFRNAATAKKP